jgi:nucleotide-binding universal stress UspA family protein
MGIDFQRDILYEEAVGHWYDMVYQPIIKPVRELGMLRWFPGHTETDLYLWVSKHRATLENELGWSIRPEAAVENLAAQENPRAESNASEVGSWRLSKMFDRYTDRLFQDILVPLNGTPESWQALDQAIQLAQKETASLHGLHILTPRARTDSVKAQSVQSRFGKVCQEAGVTGSLAIVKGDVVEQVCQRGLLTDLIVINVSHPPEPGLSSLGSGLRAIIWRSARPILTVSEKVSPMDRALVAYDGSPRSKEALFIAAYLAERWQTALTVMTVTDGGKTDASVQEDAHTYLDLHEVRADFIVTDGPPESLLDVIREREINLVLMGGYSGTVWQEVILGSVVNFLLRQVDCPILICR